MKTKVTEKGLLTPKEMLTGVDEVEIRQEQNIIIVLPVLAADPIFEIGMHPVNCEVDDASENHDIYLYS